MKKAFKKMKKRLSGDGNKKLEAQLSDSNKDSNDASSSSDRPKEVAPKPQSPRRPSTVQEEDAAKSSPVETEANVTPVPAPAPSKSQSNTKGDREKESHTNKKEDSDSDSDSEVSERNAPENGKGNGDGGSDSESSEKEKKKKRKGNDASSEVIKTYSDVPVLETNKLPRGGISIETKAVGRVQVRMSLFRF
jgi:hypothetical protein